MAAGPRSRKRFGQHFLHDRTVIERILAALRPAAGDTLVEIGPGRGALTLPLLERGLTLHAVEIDRDLAAALQASARSYPGTLELHTGDALRFDYCGLAAAGGQALRVFGNLPYNVATELIFRLLQFTALVADMHFMVQREVAERLAAEPGTGARGRLSVMVQACCDVELLLRVGPGAFVPPPAVESAVVRLVPRPAPGIGACPPEVFGELVARAFRHRRKTLRNTLRGLLDEAAIAAAGVEAGARAETLTNEQFARLGEQLARTRHACTPADKASK